MDCLLNDVAVKIPDTILDDDNAVEEFFSEAQVSKKDRASIIGICRRVQKLAIAGNSAGTGAPVDWGVSVLFAVLKYRRNNTHVVYLYSRASAAAPIRSGNAVAPWADARSFTAASYASCDEFVVVQSHEDAQRYSKTIRNISDSDEDLLGSTGQGNSREEELHKRGQMCNGAVETQKQAAVADVPDFLQKMLNEEKRRKQAEAQQVC
jgi:hypothetical protein